MEYYLAIKRNHLHADTHDPADSHRCCAEPKASQKVAHLYDIPERTKLQQWRTAGWTPGDRGGGKCGSVKYHKNQQSERQCLLAPIWTALFHGIGLHRKVTVAT